MAQSGTCNREKSIQRSFELLCEYLNFGDDFDTGEAGLVKHVLQSQFIHPFFQEFAEGYLMEAEEIEDIDFYALQSFCKRKNVFGTKKYSDQVSASSKLGWGPLNHAARFVVKVLRYSWAHDGPWGQGQWDPNSDDSEVEFWQVWMILRHLQAEWEAANLEDWSEASLEEMFGQFGLKL